MVYATDALQEQFAAELNEDEDFETPPMNFENLNDSVEQMNMDVRLFIFFNDFLSKFEIRNKKKNEIKLDFFQDHSNSGDNTSEENEIDIFAHDQLVPNEIIHNQSEACEEIDVPMDEASSNVRLSNFERKVLKT